MKKQRRLMTVSILLGAILFMWGSVAQAGSIDRNLAKTLGALDADDMVSVIVRMARAADLDSATAGIAETNRAARGNAVVSALQDIAASTQGSIMSVLAAERAAGNVASVRSYWAFNGLAVTATKAVVEAIAARADVAVVREDDVVQIPTPIEGDGVPPSTVEWGVEKIRADKVWKFFGVLGAGAVVGSIDTGTDATHPDLVNRWRGGSNSWLDAVNGLPNPYDDNSGIWHGSHTTGTMVGEDNGGTGIGVAPEAQFIACKGLNSAGSGTVSGLLDCMQWMLDPDGDPATDDFPDVVNNSWGTSPGCFTDFQSVIVAWRMSGIFPAFAAGNDGPGGTTGGSPGVNRPAFASGATDINDVIANFSSRGPSSCDGTIFPEVTAPGVDVLSVKGGGGYQQLSGTSMASPHTAGCVALMRSADPNITVPRMQNILKNTAVDLGVVGDDNTYGNGRIDCLRAVANARRGGGPPQ